MTKASETGDVVASKDGDVQEAVVEDPAAGTPAEPERNSRRPYPTPRSGEKKERKKERKKPSEEKAGGKPLKLYLYL